MQIDDFEEVIRWRGIAEDFSVVTVVLQAGKLGVFPGTLGTATYRAL